MKVGQHEYHSNSDQLCKKNNSISSITFNRRKFFNQSCVRPIKLFSFCDIVNIYTSQLL